MAIPEVGQLAPAFSALDHEGAAITLAQFRGRKVVLYFYAKDDTTG